MRGGGLGGGAVGAPAGPPRAPSTPPPAVVVADHDPGKVRRIADALAPTVVGVDELGSVDVVVLATPAPHATLAEAHLRAGASVVSVSDDVADVDRLLQLGPLARELGRTLVTGAAFAPGLSGLLARYAAGRFDVVEEIHVAAHGTGGPSCARQHHRALAGLALVWQDHMWIERSSGSGRELCWF